MARRAAGGASATKPYQTVKFSGVALIERRCIWSSASSAKVRAVARSGSIRRRSPLEPFRSSASSSDHPLSENGFGGIGGHRPRIMVALGEITPKFAQPRRVVDRLDALRHHVEPQVVTQLDDRAHQPERLGRPAHAADEGPIDL